MSLFSRAAGIGLTAGSLASGNARAMLVPERVGMPVVFDINPKSMTVKRKVDILTFNGTASNPMQGAAKGTKPITVKIKDAMLIGALSTRMSVDQLAAWTQTDPQMESSVFGQEASYAAQSAFGSVMQGAQTLTGGSAMSAPLTREPGDAGGTRSYYTVPVLLFMWGVGGPVGGGLKVQLIDMEAYYERFDWTGMPVKAKVNLELAVYQPDELGTNPTSGGVPGRARHVLADGESIYNVANAKYGNPNAWRALAQANKIDDPMRLTSGRSLFLPGPTELGGRVS